MKARLLLTCTILLMFNRQPLYCQEDFYCRFINKTNSEPGLSGELSVMPSDTITYFNNDWLKGDIFLTDGETAKNKFIKYNGFLDELFWLEPKSGMTVKLDKEEIMRFHFRNFRGDTSVYFRKIKVKRDILTDSLEIYVQEIFIGKLSLFVLHRFLVEKRESVSTNTGSFEKDIFTEEPICFLRLKNNKTVGFRFLTRKNLYTIIPDKKDQIKRFFKQAKKIRIETYPHMVLLVKFLNSIVDQ